MEIHKPLIDWTLNPGYIVTWIVLILTLVWKLGAFVTKLEMLIQRFTQHEETDAEHFRRIEMRLDRIEERIEPRR
jgi:hypothetical protein